MTTWNPSDKSANITLSGGDLTAKATSIADGAVRSTSQRAAGKTYFEAVYVGGGGADTGIGIATPFAVLDSFGGLAAGGALCFQSGGNIYINGSNTAITIGAVGSNTVCVALDLDNSQIWFRLNNGNWNGSGTANPATNTGGLSIAGLFTVSSNRAYAAASFNSATPTATARFTAASFVYTPPSGFTEFEGAPLPVDARLAGAAREALVADFYYADLAGVVREVLLRSPLAPPVVAARQTAVTINTG